jgi:hypothetical protein
MSVEITRFVRYDGNKGNAVAFADVIVREEVMPVEASNAIAALEQRICKVLKSRGPLRERDLRRYVHAERVGLWAFSTALSNLQQAGLVRYEARKKVYAVVD